MVIAERLSARQLIVQRVSFRLYIYIYIYIYIYPSHFGSRGALCVCVTLRVPRLGTKPGDVHELATRSGA